MSFCGPHAFRMMSPLLFNVRMPASPHPPFHLGGVRASLTMRRLAPPPPLPLAELVTGHGVPQTDGTQIELADSLLYLS